MGEVTLELVGPPRATGDDPCRIWGYALVTDDIDASAAWLGDRCTPPKPAVQPGRRIATVRTRELGIGPTIALMTPHVSATGGGSGRAAQLGLGEAVGPVGHAAQGHGDRKTEV